MVCVVPLPGKKERRFLYGWKTIRVVGVLGEKRPILFFWRDVFVIPLFVLFLPFFFGYLFWFCLGGGSKAWGVLL